MAEEEVGQAGAHGLGDAAVGPLEVRMEVVDLHPGEFGAVPVAGVFRVGVEEDAAGGHELAGEQVGRGAVAQGDAGAGAEGEEAVAQLEAGDEQLAVVQPAPLGAEVGAAVGLRVVSEHDEVEAGAVHRAEDVGERDLGIVGELGVGVEGAAELRPAGVRGHGLAERAESGPGARLAGEADPAVPEGLVEPAEERQRGEGGGGEEAPAERAPERAARRGGRRGRRGLAGAGHRPR